MIYQVIEKSEYGFDKVVFVTDNKEIAETYKDRAEKYVEFYTLMYKSYKETVEEIHETVAQKLYGISRLEWYDYCINYDYEKETEEDRKIREEKESNFDKMYWETLKSYPVEKRYYNTLPYVQEGATYEIKELNFEKELPELFIQRDPEEYSDVIGDEAEFLKKEFERFCDENLSDL
jgi:pyruvate/2-oxoacid:ferredoxin oxidoreductase beta subunit